MGLSLVHGCIFDDLLSDLLVCSSEGLAGSVCLDHYITNNTNLSKINALGISFSHLGATELEILYLCGLAVCEHFGQRLDYVLDFLLETSEAEAFRNEIEVA
jgi:hypothetical protein